MTLKSGISTYRWRTAGGEDVQQNNWNNPEGKQKILSDSEKKKTKKQWVVYFVTNSKSHMKG